MSGEINHMRRRLLKFLFLLPSPLIVPGLLAAPEFVVVDGWVMMLRDIEAKSSVK